MELSRNKTNYLKNISDILSIVTVTVCFVMKVPQIIKLLKLKNTRGINLIGVLMELTSYTIMISYNFRNNYAVLSYLEYPVIIIQQYILIYLILKYNDNLNIYSMFGTVIYASVAFSLLSGVVPLGIIAFLVPLCTPIGASSKVVQLLEIIRTKNSQSISILTWFISAFTNFTRIYTVFVESADLTLLLNFIVNTILSTSVMTAAILYKPQEKIAQKTQ